MEKNEKDERDDQKIPDNVQEELERLKVFNKSVLKHFAAPGGTENEGEREK